MRNNLVATCVFLGLMAIGCADSTGPVHMTEVECRLNSDCEIGSYCDPFLNLCGWDCRDDSECDVGEFCRLDTGRCAREDVPPPDASPVLEIVAGNLEDITLLGGTSDAELLRFTVVNHGERPIEVPSAPFGMHYLSGDTLDGVLGPVIVRDERSLRTVMGPVDASRAGHGLGTGFETGFVIAPGQELLLAVRTELLGASASFDFIFGNNVEMFDELRYADTGEEVSDEDVVGNYSLARHITVTTLEEMTVDGAVLLYNFVGRGGNRSERDAFHPLGTLTLTAFGGSVDFEGVTMTGAPFDGFESLGLSREGRLEGPLTPSGPGSFINLRLSTPRRIVEGESISYEVWGMLTPTSRGFEFTMRVIGLDANALGEIPLTIARLGDGDPTRIRVWTAYPILAPQPLSSTTLTNGVQQDLYKVQIRSSEASVRIGSLTFHLSGLDFGRTFTNFRVRRGPTEIAPGDYRVIQTYNGADLENGTLESFLTAQVTVIFDTPLEISGSDTAITLAATPNGFVAGDSIQVRFGDRHGTYDTMNGVLNADGTLSFPEVYGEMSWVDCVVWTDTGVRWTGTWGLETLTEFETLTR